MADIKPIDAVRLEIGGRRMLELSTRRLSSGESIIFPRLKGFGKHLSIYFPTEKRIATHVTHQYAFGRKRHTRRRLRESGKVIRDLFAALAPPDLPPPRASFLSKSSRAEWSNWLRGILPRISREPTKRPIWGLRGPMKDLYDRTIDIASGGTRVIDLSGVLSLARSRPVGFDDLFVQMTEKDLSLEGMRFGFSDDLAKVLVLMDSRRLLELRIDVWEKTVDIAFAAFGITDFLDVFMRSTSGREVLAEIRIAAEQSPEPLTERGP